jgi:hypothetical protein
MEFSMVIDGESSTQAPSLNIASGAKGILEKLNSGSDS